MALYAIADLHLSLGTDKPMDVFSGWNDYVERLEKNWRALVKDEDTVVIAGDISWAMKLEETYNDFLFIDSLPGKKIFLKGNHDYWWSTKNKIDNFLKESGFTSISILNNNSYEVDGFSIVGTRGWSYNAESEEDVKIVNREVIRLKLSLTDSQKHVGKKIVFLHYPPVYDNMQCDEIMQVLEEHEIKECYFGHIHGKYAAQKALVGKYLGINMHLISCDYINFCPLLVN